MEELKNILEQPQTNVSSQGEEISQNVNKRVEETLEGSKFGKFKNAEALFEAYNNLQADYTKKCQTLSCLQNNEKANGEKSTPSNYNYTEYANNFFANNPNAKKYEDKLLKIIVEDKEVASDTNPLNSAWNKFVNSKFLDEEELVNNEEFLQKYIFSNETIKNKIIQNYFNSLNIPKSPTLISSQKGSESVLSSVTKPKTIKEARKLVEEMFN